MSQPDQSPAAAPSTTAAVRETLESLLLALILAFIFRGFVVEAFVIPTGSMATTLLGAHMRLTCQDCAFVFDTTYQTPNTADARVPQATGPVAIRAVQINDAGQRVARNTLVDRDMAIFCPNCGYKIPATVPGDDANDARNIPVHYGDRILVSKYAYLLSEPKRWDVVVFKDPSDLPDYEQNFIKRLVALPRESVLILDGDIYIAPEGSNVFSIARKPERVQEDLWRNIYNNDFHPTGKPRAEVFSSPWRPESASAGFKLAGPLVNFSSESSTLASLNFTPPNDRFVHQLDDFLGYNQTENQGPGSPPDSTGYLPSLPTTPVSDLKLSLTYQRHSGDGPMELHVTKERRRFILRVTTSTAQLFMVDERDITASGNTREMAIGQELPLPSGPVELCLMQADYTARATVNGFVIGQTTPEQFSPDVDELIRRFARHEVAPAASVNIYAAAQDSTISHLRLCRDIHYTNTSNRGVLRHATPLFFPERVVTLRDKEYFVLGDNSPLSADARFWLDDIALPDEDLFVEPGRVPERFLLGKALVVYWPAGHRPTTSTPPIIPNFKDIRIIR